MTSLFGSQSRADMTSCCCVHLQIEKMFLVEINPPGEDDDYTLNLEQIFELNHKSRDVKRGAVQKSESIDDSTDPYEISLRIT